MQYALDFVQYAENIAQLLQCNVNRNLFRYIIIIDTAGFVEISVFGMIIVNRSVISSK